MVAGAALTLFPERCGKPMGMEDHPEVLRTIGISDLVTAPGLLVGRPRWPWMVARATLNVGLVSAAVGFREQLGDRNALIGAATFASLTVVDGLAAATLRSAER